MTKGRSWLTKARASVGSMIGKRTWHARGKWQPFNWLNQVNESHPSTEEGSPPRGAISGIYQPSAARYRISPPPAAASPEVGQWYQRFSFSRPGRSRIDWDRFEEELYAPAAKAFFDTARIIGDLRSQAGIKRKEAEISQTAQQRTEALGLLRLASDVAGKGASATTTARKGAWRIGQPVRIQGMLNKGAAASNPLRTQMSAAIRRRGAGDIASLVRSSRGLPQ